MKPLLSICLCCYNDKHYLNLLFKSIYKNTKIPFEVCVADNGSTDGTPDLLDRWSRLHDNFHHKCFPTNEGVYVVNEAVKMSAGRYVMDTNSDMIFLTGYDRVLLNTLRKLERANNGLASVSATLIEPQSGNPEYYSCDFGTDPETFDDAYLHDNKMLEIWHEKYAYKQDYWQFSHPIMMSRELWDKVGGIDMFSYPFPGYGTDIDLGAKLLEEGAWTVMCGQALVYHFSNVTLTRIEKDLGKKLPPGRKEFEEKWGYSMNELYKKFNMRRVFNWSEMT